MKKKYELEDVGEENLRPEVSIKNIDHHQTC